MSEFEPMTTFSVKPLSPEDVDRKLRQVYERLVANAVERINERLLMIENGSVIVTLADVHDKHGTIDRALDIFRAVGWDIDLREGTIASYCFRRKADAKRTGVLSARRPEHSSDSPAAPEAETVEA